MAKIPSSFQGGQGITERPTGGQQGDDLLSVLKSIVDDLNAIKARLDQHITDGTHRVAPATDAASTLTPALTTSK